VVVLSREQLDRTGYATVAAALAALPQNFSGAVNEALINTGGERGGSNAHFGSGLNLRGLGADATLVLINGHRMGGAGTNGEFTDISTIPTAAVERVEILLDGASALYGSDAVGGVVNIVMRKDFQGAETRLMSGVATAGQPFEGQVAQTFGTSWRGGGGLISYEYEQRNVLHSADRAATANADLRSLGGADHRSTFSFPGNILRLNPATGVNSPYWAVPAGQPGTGLTAADLTPGTVNLQNQREGVDVLPRQERHSLYATAHQTLTDRIEISGDFLYGHRTYALNSYANTGLLTVTRANPYFVSPNGAASTSVQYDFAELPNARASGSEESIDTSLGGDARLWGDWRAEAYGAYSRETGRSASTGLLNTIALNEALGVTADRPDTPYSPAVDGYFNPFGGEPANSAATLAYIGGGYTLARDRGTTWSLNLKADGSLVTLPGGAVRLAFGAQHREEGFTRTGTNYTTTVAPVPLAATDVGRKVDAAFAELRAPLIGPDNARVGAEQLELSLAGRVEHYSDFGWTANPKLGVLWAPADGLLLRASYGRSFRAPGLRELHDPSTNSSSLLPSHGGRISTLIESGGNPDLKPETAKSLTAGIEYTPPQVQGLRLTASWFDVRFKNRIDRPVQANIQTALDDPTVATFIQRISPATNAADRALIAALLADPATRNVLGPPESYGAIVDSRYVNTGALHVSGVDLSGAYQYAFGRDTVGLSVEATYLYRYDQEVTPTSPIVDLLDVATYPVHLRGQATLDWRRGPLGASLTAHYTCGYHDPLGVRIASLTTLDLQLRLAVPDTSPLGGVSLALTVRNLFDAGPPFYDNASGVAFDPANADLIGRFVSLQLIKSW
jgi:outer membrane receptor protein involved in Fe transport